MSFAMGDHLTTPCSGYAHHGLYTGGGFVVHKNREGVAWVTLDEFSEGADINVYSHLRERKYSCEDSVDRAFSRLGEDSYNVFFDNCEHFVNWCIFGMETSAQVQKATVAAFTAMHATWEGYVLHKKVPEMVMKYLAANPTVYNQWVAWASQKAGYSGLAASALQQLGTPTVATTVGAAVAPVSLAAGTIAGVGAAAGTAAVTGTTAVLGTAAVSGVAAVGAGAVLTTVAAPLTAAVVVGVGVKTLWDWFTD